MKPFDWQCKCSKGRNIPQQGKGGSVMKGKKPVKKAAAKPAAKKASKKGYK